MTKLFAAFLAALMMSFAASANVADLDTQPTQEVTPTSIAAAVQADGSAEPCQFVAGTGEILLAQGCCRICRKGKACGNSCINRNYTCHQPRGCACNG